MVKQEWRYLFETDIVQRGYDIFYHGQVRKIKAENDIYDFLVLDEQTWPVRIQLNNGNIQRLECHCHDGKADHLCLHIASCLIYLENQEQLPNIEFLDAKKILKQMTSEMKDQLLELALNENYELLEKANHIFGIPPNQLTRESLILNQLFMQYGYHQDAVALEKELMMFMDDYIVPNIQNNHLQQAFSHLKHLLSRLKILMVEDNFFQIESYALNQLAELLKNGGTLTDDIFAMISMDLKRDSYFEFLFDHFRTQPYLEIKLQMIDRLIKKASSFDGWAKDYYLENYVLKKMQVLYDMKDIESLSNLSDKYWYFPKVREFWIQEAIAKKNYERAIELLNISKKMDASIPALLLKYEQQLIDLYDLTKDQRYFQCLKNILFNLNPGDFDDYLRFKETCTEKQWKYYQKKLVNTPMQAERLLDILLSEKLYDEALQVAIKSQDFYFFHKYEALLVEHCGVLYTEAYANMIVQEAMHVDCEENYHKIAKLTAHLRSLPNGTKIADKLFDYFNQVYKNNAPLLKALSKESLDFYY